MKLEKHIHQLMKKYNHIDVFVYGPPGYGKTTLIGSLIPKFTSKTTVMKYEDFIHKVETSSESKLRDMMKISRSAPTSIRFFALHPNHETLKLPIKYRDSEHKSLKHTTVIVILWMPFWTMLAEVESQDYHSIISRFPVSGYQWLKLYGMITNYREGKRSSRPFVYNVGKKWMFDRFVNVRR